ncbi:unnamed protein product [Trifolium pratense]|uniref:Uncharacterized protein n=1 Tax=Trifolium pratense TaxID=57577 RepID=A0ACB0JKH5_TRIPR|nr:unnamed protein product [Trifolium pratense]
MAGVNNHQIPEHVAENHGSPMDYATYHPGDGQFASVTEDGQEGQNAHYEPYNPEEPQIPVATPPQATPAVAIPPGIPMQEMMAALVNAINRQSDLLLQQNQRYEQHNQRLEQQSRRIDAIAESRVTAQARPAHRSPTPVRSRTYSRSRSPPRHRSERRNHEKDEAGTSRRGNEKQKEERIKDSKPPRGKFTTYTPLNASRDRIFAEVSAADFKKAGIHFPRQQPMKANTDRTKFCRYHKSHGHVTEDCVHLKDAIEILIQKGYARRYVQNDEQAQQQQQQRREPQEVAMAIDVPEQENRGIVPQALAISAPEIPLPSPGGSTGQLPSLGDTWTSSSPSARKRL